MDISVQLYSVRQHLADDPSATLARLAEMGFTQVEPFGLMDHADMLRDQLPINGLTAPSSHASSSSARRRMRSLPRGSFRLTTAV